MVFSIAVISRIKFIGGGRWEGVGWVGSRRQAKPSIVRQKQHCVLSKAQKQPQTTATVNLVDLDGRWQQFDTACSLISAPQWLHRPCSGLS